MPRVVHFEVPADDPARAVEFYRQVFDWKFETWGGPEDYWLATTGSDQEIGINGAIGRRQGAPLNIVVNAIDVPSLDDFIAKVVASGGKVVRPKMPVPGVGYVAYCQDTEGNPFSLFESDETSR